MWDGTTQCFSVPPQDAFKDVAFCFSNAGPSAVSILGAKGSCGCTVVDARRRAYAPGETGRVDARLNVGQRTGRYTTKITVATDDPAAPAVALVLQADIERLVEFHPPVLVWAAGEEPTPKTATLVLSTNFAGAPGLGLSGGNFAVRIEKGASGNAFQVVASPVGPAGRCQAWASVTNGCPGGAAPRGGRLLLMVRDQTLARGPRREERNGQ